MGDESEALEDQIGWGQEIDEQFTHARIQALLTAYDASGRIPAFCYAKCPVCGCTFTKKVKAQRFCGRKRRGQSTCRDYYHNATHPARRERAMQVLRRQ